MSLSVAMTLGVFTFVLLLGNIFKDIMAMLADRSVGAGTLLHFFLLLVPYVLSFSMPMALLAATLLVMGRISADSELTAARSCGVSFFEFVLPILGLAGALSLASLYVNCVVAPQTKYLFNQAFVELAFDQPMALLEEGVSMKDFDGIVLYIGKKDMSRHTVEDVRITEMRGNEWASSIHAERGVVTSNKAEKKIRIDLFNIVRDERTPGGEANDLDHRHYAQTSETYPLELDMTKKVDQRRAVKEVHHFTSMELWKQAMELKKLGIHPTPMLVEIHKRIALSTACIAFVLVALPLGVQVHRRETSIGMLISLVLAVLYYFLIIFAESFKRNPHVYPEFIIWLPNLIFEAVGIYLLWRQHRV